MRFPKSKFILVLSLVLIPALVFSSKAPEKDAPVIKMPYMGPITTPAFMSLEGEWDFLPLDKTIDEVTSSSLKGQWGTINVPALWWEAKLPKTSTLKKTSKDKNGKSQPWYNTANYAWYRYTFRMSSDLSTFQGRILFGQVKWSCEAWLNGHKIGYHLGGYAPFDFEISSYMKPGKENVLLLKVGGWGSIPMKNGKPEITTGTVADWANKSGGITDSVELRFYKRLAVQSIFAIPHPNDSTVQVQVTIKNPKDVKPGDKIDVYLNEKTSIQPISQISVIVDKNATSGMAGTDVVIAIPDAKLWWPWRPFLYQVTALLKDKHDKPLDIQSANFGLRDFKIKDGHFYLNGQRIQLRGANLFDETEFGLGSKATLDPRFVKRYLVDVPREANITAFRTHLGPMNQRWLDMCDSAGVMIISEFPLSQLSNNWEDTVFGNFAFQEFKDLLPALWNHPSILIWSISNESWSDYNRSVETKLLEPLIKRMDPTRPILRAGDASSDMIDIHAYEGVWTKSMADFRKRIENLKKLKSGKPLLCTEYLETGSNDSGIWYDKARAKMQLGNHPTAIEMLYKHASLAAEQTEILRVNQFDGIFPYWYADWVNAHTWAEHPDDTTYPHPKPTYYALKNALAPVSIMLDMETTRFEAGSNITVPVKVMNDTPMNVPVSIKVYVLVDNPYYVPQRVKEFAKMAQYYDTSSAVIPPFTVGGGNLVIPVDEGVQGHFYLVGLLTRTDTNRSVLSQRSIEIEGTDSRKAGKQKK